MDIQLAQRIQRIKPSPTLMMTARAAALKAAGRDIISLGAGEPDFDTPEHIKAAAIQAINNGFTKYTAVDGTPALKQAIINKFSQENNLVYKKDQIIVSVGGKQSFFNLTQSLLNSGDEVIIPAPYWVSYPDIVLLADGIPVIVPTTIDNSFKITPDQLAAAITPRTRLFVINSPSNPTGVGYNNSELAALGEVLRRFPHVLIASDDMYEHIRWDTDPFRNILNICPDLYERTIVLNGVSKTYAMTGWRIGYCAAPAPLVAAMTNIQSQSTSNPTSIAQVAAQAALEGGLACVLPMVKAFHSRHDFVVNALNRIQGVRCLAGNGTFYAFPDVRAAIAALPGVDNDLTLSEYLLEHTGVAVVPGSAFGAPGHIRLSFATSMTNLETALARLAAVFN